MMHSAKFLLAVCTGVGLVGLAQGSVQAATLTTYDLTVGGNANAPSLGVIGSAGGSPSLTVRGIGGNVGRRSTSLLGADGLGMGVGSQTGLLLGSDVVNVGETLQFEFGQLVRIVSATFTRLDIVPNGDDFTLAIDSISRVSGANGDLGVNPFDNGNQFLDNGTRLVTFAGLGGLTPAQLSGFFFDFGVQDNNDDYKLSQIVVEFGTDVVPTPALLPGLVGLGLGVIRRRRQQLVASAKD
jgi:hypothetical protein